VNLLAVAVITVVTGMRVTRKAAKNITTAPRNTGAVVGVTEKRVIKARPTDKNTS
jgi:hypothetical protein